MELKGGERGEKKEGDETLREEQGNEKKDGNGRRYERNNSPSNFGGLFTLF
jgi:hypothetical protein